MKTLFILQIHNLNISSNLGNGDKINEHLRITNDVAKIKNLISPVYYSIIGELEISALLSGSPVIYSESELPDELMPQQYLVSQLYEVQSFLMSTWLEMDNAISTEIGFLLYTSGTIARADSNLLSHTNSMSDGKKLPVTISRNKLQEIREIYRNYFISNDHKFILPPSQLTTSKPRLARALYMIGAARSESDTAIKITNFCTAFETLFATSQTNYHTSFLNESYISCLIPPPIDLKITDN